MKNLIKLSLYLLSFTFLLVSCGGDSSTKGAWSSSELDQCRADLKEGMQEEMISEEIESFEMMYGSTIDDVCDCMCSKIEDMYSSYFEADIKIENDLTEDDAAAMMISCMLSSADSDEEIEKESIEEVDSSKN